MNDAGDRVLIVDESLLPLYERFRARRPDRAGASVIGSRPRSDRGYLDYEELLAQADLSRHRRRRRRRERRGGNVLHLGHHGAAEGSALFSPRHRAAFASARAWWIRSESASDDTVLPIVPMFHVNAWGLPFTCTLFGVRPGLAGPHLDAEEHRRAARRHERVTLTAGVPTVWLGLLQELDAHPGQARPELPEGRRRRRQRGAGVDDPRFQGAPRDRRRPRLGHDGDDPARHVVQSASAPSATRHPKTQHATVPGKARRCPFVEIRAATGSGIGAVGRRRRWVSSRCGDRGSRGSTTTSTDRDDRFTADGWFKTGDIVTINSRGCIALTDRAKDLVKSGGEWISSVALENALMGHPKVAEAAVVAVPHPTWDERPLAVVVLKQGSTATAGGAGRVPRARLREVVAARHDRVRDGDPTNVCGQVQEIGPEGGLPGPLPADVSRGGGDDHVCRSFIPRSPCRGISPPGSPRFRISIPPVRCPTLSCRRTAPPRSRSARC